jgi:biopolymer transport protein ExbB/TolQ
MDALVPAALGLAVAIAVVVMYGSLCVRLDRIAADLEASASHVVGYFAARKEKERK